MAFVGHVGQLRIGNGQVVGVRSVNDGPQLVGIACRLMLFLVSHLKSLLLGYHLNHAGLRVAQTDLVAHDAILHGVFQRRVEQHLNVLALNEAHLHHALAETAMSHHLDNDARLARMQL